jgi:primosomal protein N' (replication factor Y)
MATFAKVAIESPLPQLDRLFDYLVPEDLAAQIAIGQQILVPFSKSPKPVTGFVVELADTVEFSGTIASVLEISSARLLLPSNIYNLVRAVADRQAVTFGDVAKTAIPTIAVRADKTWVPSPTSVSAGDHEPELVAKLSEPRVIEKAFGDDKIRCNAWIADALDIALSAVVNDASAIICVPDFRDVDVVADLASELGFGALITRYGSELTRTERYISHLNAMEMRPQIVVGTRSALFAPLQNLQQIVIWDDEDPSHYDQSSPYVSSREVALIRQKLEKTSLTFLSHYRSTAVERLVKLGYLTETTVDFAKPAVAFSERDVRLDSLAFSTVREGLLSGPVLIQVSNLGVAKSAYCKGCATRALCQHCAGPLWIDAKNETRCRWCNGFNLSFICAKCQGTQLRMGRAGSTRTVAELGRAFPGIPVIEATGATIVRKVDSRPKLVVSTPGAEPHALGGYSSVVVLDCDIALAKDSLHAREDAVRAWANAISLGSKSSRSALIGVGPEIGTFMATWRMKDFAIDELGQRSKLGFPPAQRLLSATGERTKVSELVEHLEQLDSVSKLGIAPTEIAGEWRALLRFSYSAGSEVADLIRVFQLKNSGAKRMNHKSGHNQRAVSIKIDDPRVL